MYIDEYGRQFKNEQEFKNFQKRQEEMVLRQFRKLSQKDRQELLEYLETKPK